MHPHEALTQEPTPDLSGMKFESRLEAAARERREEVARIEAVDRAIERAMKRKPE